LTPITVIIEPASVDNIWRAPSAPTPNKRGHWPSHWLRPAESASINATAKTMLAVTISEGINQKLDRRLPRSCLNLFICHFQLRISGMALRLFSIKAL